MGHQHETKRLTVTSETSRVFFALWPSEQLRMELAARMVDWIGDKPCRVMTQANLHVTLAFIGSIPAARLGGLVRIAQAMPTIACKLEFDRLAIWRPARVLVLSASHTPTALLQWVQEFQARLTQADFAVDTRPYRPHVTLARDVRVAAMEEMTPKLQWQVHDFALVESVSSPGGVHYQVLNTFAK